MEGGVAYERIGEWNKAEKDLLSSLAAKTQPSVCDQLSRLFVD